MKVLLRIFIKNIEMSHNEIIELMVSLLSKQEVAQPYKRCLVVMSPSNSEEHHSTSKK